MRREKRQVLDLLEIDKVIAACHCCRLGFCDNGLAYIVPMNFGYSVNDGKRTFYFHSAKEGRKIDLIRANPLVSFELDTNYELYGQETACSYSAYFQSVIGHGVAAFVDDPAEKREALQYLMLQNTGSIDWEIPDKALDGVCIFQLEVVEMTCKSHQAKQS